MRELNSASLDLIKSFEGLRLKVYRDPVKLLTVGYGHLILPRDGLKFGDAISQEGADELLQQDLAMAINIVESFVRIPLNDNQFGALVSFTFNLGGGNLLRSSLFRHLNLGDYKTAADRFLLWTRAGGRVLPGLVRRRKAERELFLSPVSMKGDSE